MHSNRHAKNNLREKLRKKILALRDELDPATRHQKSLLIMEKLWRLDLFTQARSIFAYIHFRSEVETLPIIKQALAEEKKVCAPLTDFKDKRLFPYLITNLEKDLMPGYCSIPEPDPRRTEPFSPAQIDLVLLPGSVFDEHGGRLGYGGGYYDRFLATEAPAAKRIALAFDVQIVPELPLRPHDQKYDYLITEKRIIKALDREECF